MVVGAHYAIISFLAPSAKTTTTQRKPVALSSISAPFSSKLKKRKNHLRPKLLKTLTKSFPQEPPANPIIPIEITHEHDLELPFDQVSGEPCPAAAGEDEKNAELFETSGTVGIAGVVDSGGGKFSTRSVLKFGMYLVGLFVFQTICAVWVLGSANSDHEHENSEIENKNKILLNGNGKSFRGKFGSKPGAFVHVDESELEAKIIEIRAMARKARESEGKEAKTDGYVSDFDDTGSGEIENESASSRVRSGIEKEVGARLIKLQKRLNSIWEKSPGSLVSYLSKFGKVEDKINKDISDVKEADSALMFKKKHKFRSQFTKPRNSGRGFQGSEDNCGKAKKRESASSTLDSVVRSESIGISGLNSLDQEQQIDLPNGNLEESISGILDEDEGRELLSKDSKSLHTDGKKLKKERGRTKVGQEMGVANTKPSTGVIQETSSGRHSVEEMKSRESSDLEERNSPNFTKENQDTTAKSNKAAVLGRNSRSSQSRKVGRKPVANKIRDMQSDFQNDLWWSNLPYALGLDFIVHKQTILANSLLSLTHLGILLSRDSDHEGLGGLYTLKITSHAQDHIVSAYTVAFEDRGDANNFCYLLESFFEDLGDFSADIVPLSIKELHEAVKSHTMKLLVVKKGQLQLYAGQPLADVEMALRSLVEQSRSA